MLSDEVPVGLLPFAESPTWQIAASKRRATLVGVGPGGCQGAGHKALCGRRRASANSGTRRGVAGAGNMASAVPLRRDCLESEGDGSQGTNIRHLEDNEVELSREP